jgi:integrase/recombinase XerD
VRQRRDIHNYSARLKALSDRIRSTSTLDDREKISILKFQQQCTAEGIGEARILKYLHTLLSICKMKTKCFDNMNRDDVVRLVEGIEKRKDWSDWTKHDFKVTLKKFYRYLRGISKRGIYPEEVDWITTTMKNSNSRLPEEVLTEEEVEKLARAATSSRDKALVNVFYESGARPGELLNLKIKDVTFDELGAVILVSGKTGDRRIRLVAAAPALAEWINSHPESSEPTAYVWPISDRAVAKVFKSLAARAKIKKRVMPYIFRHSRATHLATKLTEQQLKQLMGWTMGSSMAQVYVHLSGRDLDNALLALHGLASE